MLHILEWFFCGLAFAMGVTSFFFVRDLVTEKGRAAIKNEMMEHAKKVEDRMAVQVATMIMCLEEIKNMRAKSSPRNESETDAVIDPMVSHK